MNIHHELIDEYAEDWKTTHAPWLLWQLQKEDSDEWRQCSTHPDWVQSRKYRRKPRTIRIGNYDVPEPLRVAPEIGTVYYYPYLVGGKGLNGEMAWDGDKYDSETLKKGKVHLTKEAAELHAKALISLTEQQ